MRTTLPTLHEWHGAQSPKICTVQSLGRTIPPARYSQVYWIAKITNNVVVETHLLTDWYFMADGRLCGRVDTGVWKLAVEIALDEFVILSVV